MSQQTLIQSDITQYLTDPANADTPKAHAAFGDAPYALEFMGKEWDKHGSPKAFQEWVTGWAAPLLNHVYPGAVLAMFGGTRTYHRLACGLEDAGWEIFDECAAWIYGCVDTETEILTKDGWRRYHKDMEHQQILCYNVNTQEFTWDYPSYVHHYQYDDTAYHIQSDSTDQLVSRNHRVLVERGGALVFQPAEQVALEQEIRVPILERMPTMRRSFPDLRSGAGAQEEVLRSVFRQEGIYGAGDAYAKFNSAPKERPIVTQADIARLSRMRQGILSPELISEESESSTLQSGMQREGTGEGVGGTWLQGKSLCNAGETQSISAAWRSESSVEGRRNLPQAARKLCQPVNQIRALPVGIYQHGAERRLRNGASVVGRAGTQSPAAACGSCASRRSRCDQQQDRKSRIVRIQPRSQALRTSWVSRTDLARITPTHYTGIMWCPTVSTGAFVARRNSHVFITGNSGFPKSHDISKAIDVASGAKRTEGAREWQGGQRSSGIMGNNHGTQSRTIFDTPVTSAAQTWDGYGTALKPSRENIVLARAPRTGYTFAQLAEQFGTGALNIDGSRIETNGEIITSGFPNSKRNGVNNANEGWLRPWMLDTEKHGSRLDDALQKANEMGRFPANTMFVCECEGDHEPDCPIAILDQQSGNRKAGASKTGEEPSARTKNVYGKYQNEAWEGYRDEGGASRFFYQAKASAWEKSAGLEAANPHPTVKPIQLCEAICRLLLPPTLDKPRHILIPFAGSGREMIGAHLAGWDAITGIELMPEYCAINEARRKWWSGFTSYEQAQKAFGVEKKTPMPAPEEKKYVQTAHF